MESIYTYDLAGRLTALTHQLGTPALATYAYAYDAANRITQVTAADGTSAYTYDERDQLIGADHSDQGDEAYRYDANGNRTHAGYITGPNNQLLADGQYSYEYDAEGNLTRQTDIATGQVTELTWDHRNRLIQVTETDAAGNVLQTAAYGYDLYNRRIAKVVDPDGAGAALATTERFVYNNEHIALVFDGNGQQTHRYLHGPRIDQVLAEETPTGQVVWALADHQGTVRDWVDSQGVVMNHLSYDSFGNLTHQTNPTAFFRFGYTGREHDLETGYIYYRNRYTFKGRFISQDPLSFAAGDANLYRYVGNNPLNLVDPSGTTSTELTKLLSIYSRPSPQKKTIYIYNQKFPDYSRAFVDAQNWFFLITDPSQPLEPSRNPPRSFPWTVSTALKGPTGRAIFRPGGTSGIVPTIQLIKDENEQYHNTPNHPASEIKFLWEGGENDRCPVIPQAPKKRPQPEPKLEDFRDPTSLSKSSATKTSVPVPILIPAPAPQGPNPVFEGLKGVLCFIFGCEPKI